MQRGTLRVHRHTLSKALMCRCLLRCVVRRIHFIAATTERRIDLRALTHPSLPRMMSRPMGLSRSRAAAAAHDAPAGPAPLPTFELQELWFSTLRAEWSSLAVVPAHAGGSAYEIARALAEAGSRHRGTPVRFVKGDADDLAQTAQFVESLSHKSGG